MFWKSWFFRGEVTTPQMFENSSAEFDDIRLVCEQASLRGLGRFLWRDGFSARPQQLSEHGG
jgi:hypothetical protein